MRKSTRDVNTRTRQLPVASVLVSLRAPGRRREGEASDDDNDQEAAAEEEEEEEDAPPPVCS